MVRHKNRWVFQTVRRSLLIDGCIFRYFVVRVRDDRTSDTDKLDLKANSLFLAITKKLQQMHGDFGVAAVRAGFTSKYCNPFTKIAIIRCRHGPHSLISSVLPLVNNVESRPVALETMYTGATIRQCFHFIRRYQQKKYVAVCKSLTSDTEKTALKAMLDCKTVLEITWTKNLNSCSVFILYVCWRMPSIF